MASNNLTRSRRKAQPSTKQLFARYGYLISAAARRGYSQRALLALALAALAAEQAKVVRHA